MNICFFTNNYSFTGGLERVLSLVSSELSKTNNVHVVSMYNLSSNNFENNSYSSKVKIKVLFNGKKEYLKQIIPSVKMLKIYLVDNKIDVVIATSEFVGPYCYFACKNINTKCVVWTHTPTLNYEESVLQKPIKNFVFKKMDYIFTLTPESKEKIIKHFNKKEVIDIPNPIDPELLNTNSYNVNSKKIITVGRLCKQKNIEKAIEVGNIILKNNNEWTWDVFGNGDEKTKNELQDAINKYDLKDRFILKGNVTNLYDRYKEYSILVMTSKYEGFPMVLLEGIANRLPLISFNVSTGPNLLIEDGGNGYLVKPFDGIEMAKKIQTLIDNINIRNKMSQNSELLIDKYKISNICNIWEESLKKVIDNEE